MTVITTETIVPVGTRVTYQRGTQTRAFVFEEGGYREERTGALIPADRMVGAIVDGHLRYERAYQPGELYLSGQSQYHLILGVNDDETDSEVSTLLAQDSDGGPALWLGYRKDENLGTRVEAEDLPPWYRAMWLVGQRYEAVRRENVGNRRTRTAQSTALTTLTSALGEYATDHYDDLPDGLTDLLDEFNIDWSPPRETITVTVSISGSTQIDAEDHMGLAEIERAIQGDRLADWSSGSESIFTVSWSATAPIEVEVPTGDCGCDEVDDEMVENWLDSQGFHYTSFEVDSTSCSNG